MLQQPLGHSKHTGWKQDVFPPALKQMQFVKLLAQTIVKSQLLVAGHLPYPVLLPSAAPALQPTPQVISMFLLAASWLRGVELPVSGVLQETCWAYVHDIA